MTTDRSGPEAIRNYYEEMSAARKRIVGPLVALTLFVFFLQQVLTNFTSLMDGFLAKGVGVAYVYALALFFYAVIVTMIYNRAMDRVEQAHRPPILDADSVEQYEDWRNWERHQAELEHEEELREDLEERELAEEIRRAHHHKDGNQ